MPITTPHIPLPEAPRGASGDRQFGVTLSSVSDPIFLNLCYFPPTYQQVDIPNPLKLPILTNPPKSARRNNHVLSDHPPSILLCAQNISTLLKMARSVQTTTIQLDMSATQARTTMQALQTQAKQLKAALDNAVNIGDKNKAKQLQAQLTQTNTLIRNMQSNARNASSVLASLDRSSPNELKRTLSYLTRQLGKMSQGTEAYIRTAENIRRVRDQLNTVNTALRQQESYWSRLKKSGAVAVGMIQGGLATLSGLKNYSQEAVEHYANMQAEMANVQKFSGMTDEQVAALNEEFKKMDTRTGREELNRLAQDAGRLGKNSVDDVMGFVRAADKINVALDDLGDGATLTLSKLAGLFGVEKEYGTEQSLLKVGAVINDLSQNCSASAPYIAEFTSRMGAAGVQAGMTIPQIMAYAAVMDECNVNVEASSTALSQLIMKIFKEPAKYAKAAGLEVKEFYQTMTTDANAGFLMLIEALSKKGRLDRLAPIFSEMGANGSEAQKALGLLTQNIDKVRAQQEVANESFAAGTSIGDEFAVQNNTVAASLDKARNGLHEISVEIGEQLLPVVQILTSWGAGKLSILRDIIKFIADNRTAVLSLTAAVVTYVAVAKVHAAWDTILIGLQRAKNALLLAGRAAALLCSAAYYALTGNLTKAAVAMRAFRIASGGVVSILAAVVAAISAVVVGLVSYTQKNNAAIAATETLNKLKEKSAERTAEEIASIKALLSVAQDETASLDARHAAINKLNKIIPNYNAQLNATTGQYQANKAALDNYLASLTKYYEVQGAQDMLKELGKEKARLTQEKADLQEEMTYTPDFSGQQTISTSGSAPGNVNALMGSAGTTAGQALRLKGIEKKLAVNQAKTDAILKTHGTAIATTTNPEAVTVNPESVVTPEGTGAIPVDKAALKAAEKARREAEKARKAAEKKARDDFKKGLEEIDAERERADAESIASYRVGAITYHDYRSEMEEHEEKMLMDKIEFYKNFGLEEDEDSAALKKKLEEARSKWAKEATGLKLRDIRANQSMAENQAQLDYASPGSDIFRNEEKLQERLFLIRLNALHDTKNLYVEGSQERADTVAKIEQEETEEQLRKQKDVADKLMKYQEQYTTLSIQKRRDMELASLDTLHTEGLISEEEYQKTRAKIIKKYKKEIDEFGKEDFKPSDEWAAMTKNMYDSLKAFFDTSEDDMQSWAGKVSALAKTTFAVFSTASQMASSLMAANVEYDVAVISKAYDRQIAAASQNSARQQRLEKQKEKAISAQRAKSAKRDFALQVATAIAQTAMNGVQAYYEGLKIGGLAGLIMAPIAAAMAVAAGGIQIATIKKQQETAMVTGYASGGFTKPGAKYEPAGIVHAGEWVANRELVQNPATRPLIDILEYARLNNSLPTISASDVSGSVTSYRSGGSAISSSVSRDAAAAETLNALADALGRLNERLSSPIRAAVSVSGPDGSDQAKRRYNQLIKNRTR